MRKKYVSTAQAAIVLGTTPQRIRELLGKGRIVGAFRSKRGYHAWRIPITAEGRIAVTPAARWPSMLAAGGIKALAPSDL